MDFLSWEFAAGFGCGLLFVVVLMVWSSLVVASRIDRAAELRENCANYDDMEDAELTAPTMHDHPSVRRAMGRPV